MNGYGLPVEFEITSGEVNDCSAAPDLIARLPDAKAMIADKGYEESSGCDTEKAQLVKRQCRYGLGFVSIPAFGGECYSMTIIIRLLMSFHRLSILLLSA